MLLKKGKVVDTKLTLTKLYTGKELSVSKFIFHLYIFITLKKTLLL